MATTTTSTTTTSTLPATRLQFLLLLILRLRLNLIMFAIILYCGQLPSVVVCRGTWYRTVQYLLLVIEVTILYYLPYIQHIMLSTRRIKTILGDFCWSEKK